MCLAVKQSSRALTRPRGGGCAVRVLTTLQEGGGTNMLAGFTISLALNLALVLQILYYRPKAEKAKKQ